MSIQWRTSPITPRAGERWTTVVGPDGSGPYRALVHNDPCDNSTLIALFPQDQAALMVDDMDRDRDGIYGGLAWTSDEPAAVLVYADADDDSPRRIAADERGLYPLNIFDAGWTEQPARASRRRALFAVTASAVFTGLWLLMPPDDCTIGDTLRTGCAGVDHGRVLVAATLHLLVALAVAALVLVGAGRDNTA